MFYTSSFFVIYYLSIRQNKMLLQVISMKIQIKSEMDLINYILLVPEILLVHKRSSQITNFSSGYFSDCLCPGKKKSPENSLASNRNTQ